MKTNFLTRVYAIAISAVFASVATVGVAVLMDASGQHGRTDASATARQSAEPAKSELTQWKVPVAAFKQVL